MGNPCGAGTGQPKPGAGAVAIVTNLLVSAILSRYGYGWLSAIVGAIPALSFDVEDFCTDGQPALPEITADDVLALLNPFVNPNNPAATLKVKDVVLHYLWYELCDCVGTIPTPPDDPQTPPDVVGVGDVGTDACLTKPTQHIAYEHAFITGSVQWGNIKWGQYSSNDPSNGFDPAVTVRSVKISFHRNRAATGVHEDPWHAFWVFQNGNLSYPDIVQEFHVSGTDDYEAVLSVPTGYNSGFGQLFPSNSNAEDQDNPDDIFDITVSGFCYSLPATAQECCPPDPSLLSAIAQLQSDLALVKSQADLIQRQAAPFGYVEGDSHTGLTGTGHIEVADLLGVKIALQVIPSYIGYEVGETYEVFTESWINWANNVWAAPRERIRGYTQLSFPRNAGVYTRINYTLQPGLQIALIELVREP